MMHERIVMKMNTELERRKKISVPLKTMKKNTGRKKKKVDTSVVPKAIVVVV